MDIKKEYQEMGSILMQYMADLLLDAKSRHQKILIIQSY